VKGLLRRLDLNIDFENRPQNDRDECEDHIEEGDGPGEPEGLTRSHTIVGICDLNGCEDHIFVEEVKDHF
jgi:hypothetical protein